MSELKCDTEKIMLASITVLNETKKINNNIEYLYSRLYAIQKEDIWLGYASDKFLENISNDKNEMLTVSKNLEEYGKTLENFAEKFSDLAKKYRSIE